MKSLYTQACLWLLQPMQLRSLLRSARMYMRAQTLGKCYSRFFKTVTSRSELTRSVQGYLAHKNPPHPRTLQ